MSIGKWIALAVGTVVAFCGIGLLVGFIYSERKGCIRDEPMFFGFLAGLLTWLLGVCAVIAVVYW